jgi:ORF6N domain
MTDKKLIASVEQIESRMFLIRGQKVMLSMHLAELYEVEPRLLVQAVKRNIERFPEDFMFQLSTEEFANLKSQIGISSWGGVRTAPYAFTEQGVSMLSSVLHSTRAIQFKAVFEAIRELMAPLEPRKKRPIGFAPWEKK